MGPDGQSEIKYPHVYVATAGEDHSIFKLLDRVIAGLQAGGVPQAEVDAFFQEASSGDHDHALRVIAYTVQVRTAEETVQMAEELADNGVEYVPDSRLGICVTCGKMLSPDDILTITGTWRETGNCDQCLLSGLPEPFESIYRDIVRATAPLTNDVRQNRRIVDPVMPILLDAIEGGMQELIRRLNSGGIRWSSSTSTGWTATGRLRRGPWS